MMASSSTPAAATMSPDMDNSTKAIEPSTPLNIRHPRQGEAPGASHSDPSAGNSDSQESFSGPTDHEVGSSEVSSGEFATGGARHRPARNLAGTGHRYLPSFSGNSSTAYDSEDAGAPLGNGSPPTRSPAFQRWVNSALRHSSSESSSGSFMPTRGRLNTFGRPGGAPLVSSSHRLRRQATLKPTNESHEGGAQSSLKNADGNDRQTITDDLETPTVLTFAAAATSDASSLAVPKRNQGATSTGTGYRSVTNFTSQAPGGFDLQANNRQLYTGTAAAQSPHGSNHPESFGQSALRPTSSIAASSSHGFRDNVGHGNTRAVSHYSAVPPPPGLYHQENDHPFIAPTPPRGPNRQEIDRYVASSPGIAAFPGPGPVRFIQGGRQPFLDDTDATLRNAELASAMTTRANKADDAVVVDPQAIYPAEACIFVANLADSKNDDILMAAVTREFSRFGTVFVKIRRDEKTGLMPFAFCQFTNRQDADNALVHGRGIHIHGRPCRTERAKSSRWFVIFRRDGNTMTLAEARMVMQDYGHVSQVAMHEDHSIKVQFENFSPQQRDIQLMSHHNNVYQVEQLTERRRENRDDSDIRFYQEYDLARRSLYVSQLPEGADEEELSAYFSLFGQVASVLIITPPRGQRFSFVEFVHAVSVENALSNTANQPIRGRYTMRVERKFCKANPRRVRSMQLIEGNEANEHNQVAPTTPGHSMPFTRNRRDNFAGASPYGSVSPQHTSPHMYAGRGPPSGGRIAPSPARFDGGFSIAGPRTTPGRPQNRGAMQPSMTPSSARHVPFAGPLRYTGGPSPAPRTITESDFAAHAALQTGMPVSAMRGEMAPPGPIPQMGPYQYQYVAADPFTGTPAFMAHTPAFMAHAPPAAPRDEPVGQERGSDSFNTMLDRLDLGQRAAQDAEHDSDNEAGEKGKNA